MTLFYSFGGGMGHVSRSIAIARQSMLGDYRILTATGFAADLVDKDKLIFIDQTLQKDISQLQQELTKTLNDNGIKEVFLDSFPVGILGELIDFKWPSEIRVNYVARLLKWRKYLSRFSFQIPKFDRVLQVEKLHKEHQEFLDANYTVENLKIKKPSVLQKKLTNEKYALICHSGNEEEQLELCRFALEVTSLKNLTDLKLFLISPEKPADLPEGIEWRTSTLARQYFEYSELIVTACGFNLMNECLPHKGKHFFLPFDRKFDDQFSRASSYRNF